MRHLFLNGFMATGKSTLGPVVGSRLGLPFLDLDAEIERKSGTTIATIFESRGESEFRRLEEAALRTAIARPPSVIALGGGALQNNAARTAAESTGLIVTLSCSPVTAAARIQEQGEELRPVGMRTLGAEGVDGLRRLLDRRAALYDPYPLVSTEGSPESAIEEIVDLYRRHRSGERGAVYQLRFPTGEQTVVLFGSARLCDLDLDGSRQIALITDSTVAGLHGPALDLATEGTEERISRIVIPPGEAAKNLDTVRAIYGSLKADELERGAVMVAAGGGVVCDVAGFAAATYLRGLELVLVPTTLLAQVDAAIGGKTGVDFDGVKNLVGSFHPARLVCVDSQFLNTLPEPALGEGIAEMVKIGFARDEALFGALEGLEAVGSIRERSDLVRRAVRNKIAVVSRDPFERTGERAVLNFGHTIGHALESLFDYRRSHGACVAMGMVAEARVAQRIGSLEGASADRLESLLSRLGLPTELPEVPLDDLRARMAQDKKRHGGKIPMVMGGTAGRVTLEPVALDEVTEGLAQVQRAPVQAVP